MATLFHYCSNTAFLSIVSSHKIYASEFTLSNDVLEGKWIKEVVQDYCRERELSYFHSTTIIEEVETLTGWLGAAGICLSQEDDLLSQWRAYSSNGSGVSIGFDQNCFGVEGSGLPSLQPIIYTPSAQKQAIKGPMDRAIDLVKRGAIASVRSRTILALAGRTDDDKRELSEIDKEFQRTVFELFPLLYILKNPAFQEEKEWRSISLILPPNKLFPDTDSEGAGWHLNHMEFRALVDRIIPYKEFSLDTTLGRPVIREIVLGPRNVTPVGVIEAALLRYGWSGVTVRKSTASYR